MFDWPLGVVGRVEWVGIDACGGRVTCGGNETLVGVGGAGTVVVVVGGSVVVVGGTDDTGGGQTVYPP
jgi:hypothetical protein